MIYIDGKVTRDRRRVWGHRAWSRLARAGTLDADGEEEIVSSGDGWRMIHAEAPRGAVRATPRIAAWFNRVGYYHGRTENCSAGGCFIGRNYEGATKPHGGLYLYPRRDRAVWEARRLAENDVMDFGGEVLWSVYRVTVAPGDWLAVDEDEWLEGGEEHLHLWGAGASVRELRRGSRGRWHGGTGIWYAPRVWAERFVLRWSHRIIDTCVGRGFVPPHPLPALRVWRG